MIEELQRQAIKWMDNLRFGFLKMKVNFIDQTRVCLFGLIFSAVFINQGEVQFEQIQWVLFPFI